MFNLADEITVTVTQEHISNGKAGNPYRCPVALAIREKIGKWHSVRVYITDARVGFLGCDYLLDGAVREFARRFDRNKFVEPVTFTMRRER